MSTATTIASREFHLVARPDGEPATDQFALVERELPPPAAGEVLVRNTQLSVDPFMRERMDDAESYIDPGALGLYRGDNLGKMVVRLDPSRD